MHYYQFNIGDYRKDTTYLSMLEHGAYRQLLDWHYLEQAPIPLETEVVMRRLSARTNEERLAIEFVLKEYFIHTENGYIQERVLHEIGLYEAKADRAKTNGKLGGRPLKTKEVISGLSNKTQTKAKLRTKELINQLTNKPNNLLNNIKNIHPRALLEAENISKNIINDFMAIRKAKKLPLTKSALDGIKREAEKINLSLQQALEQCCTESWAGFKADWVLNQNKQSQAPPDRTQFQQSTTDVAYEKMFGKMPIEKEVQDAADRV